MIKLISPNFLIISIMALGVVNLITPFITKENSLSRTIIILFVTLLFFFNVLILDCCFLQGIEINSYMLFDLDKYSLELYLEPVGLIFLNMLAVLWVISLLYTIGFLKINNIADSHRYLFFINCCVITGCFIALSANLLTMFIGYELLTIFTVPLIVHNNSRGSENLLTYLGILMISSTMLLLPAIIIVYNKAGHGNFIINGFIKFYFSHSWSVILVLMFIFGIAKTAIFPIHQWLPKAMVASYPVSALLHAVVVVKTGLFCVYKIIIYIFGLDFLHSLFINYNWLLLIAGVTVIYSSIQAIIKSEIKIILAYSTISQLAVALVSAFLFTPQGIKAAILHMLSHAFTKISIFYSIGIIYSIKNTYTINELEGMKYMLPKVSLIALVSALSLIGIPPFAGFISKTSILLAAAEQSNIFAMIILVISSIFSTVYMTNIILHIYKNVSNELLSEIKIKKNFFYFMNIECKNKYINNLSIYEKQVPVFMLLSIIFSLAGVILFFSIKGTINKLLVFL